MCDCIEAGCGCDSKPEKRKIIAEIELPEAITDVKIEKKSQSKSPESFCLLAPVKSTAIIETIKKTKRKGESRSKLLRLHMNRVPPLKFVNYWTTNE